MCVCVCVYTCCSQRAGFVLTLAGAKVLHATRVVVAAGAQSNSRPLLPVPGGEDQSLERTIRMEEHERRLNVCSAQSGTPHAQSCS